MRIRDRPSSGLVMQRGAYESSCRAATKWREGGGNYNPRYARYLLFCSFGDTFINQTPSLRRSSSAFFKRQHTTCRDWPRYTPTLFFSSSPLLTFLLPRDSLPPPCASKTVWQIRKRRNFVKATPRISRRLAPLREICLATKFRYFVLQGNVLQYWIRIRVMLGIMSTCRKSNS